VPTFTWGTGMPNTGALKVSQLSAELFYAAIAETVFVDQCTTEPGFGKNKGESVTLPRISNQAELTDASLLETERIPEKTHTVTGKVITVREFGEAVPLTEFAKDLSQFNLQNTVQRKLKDSMRLALDTRACAAFKSTLYKYVPTGVASATTATNGTAPTSALANMNVYHAAVIRDTLFDTYKAPKEGDSYIGIFRAKGLRGIKDDQDWEFWHQYTDPQAKYNSEVGRIEEIRFIETNHGGSTVGGFGLNIVGTSSVLGEGVVFGADAVRAVEALTPTLRVGLPQDFERSQSVAWYGVYEFSIIWDTANAGELRIVHVTST
jgi:N4-gp56 family major capsid protein